MDAGLSPQPADRVAARAVVIAVVACRGFIDPQGERELWNRVQQWFSGLGIDGELDHWEKALIAKPLGSLEPQEQVDAAWLSEGMVVLAWALGRYEIPAYDRRVVAGEVADALGFLKPFAETVLAKPSLLPISEIAAFREGIFALHWRLNEWRITRCPINFPEVAADAWFGPMSLALARLTNGDLAIGQTRIDEADGSLLSGCLSIVRERHRAANWLLGENTVFSEVDTST